MTRRLVFVLVVSALVASGCGSRVRQAEWDRLAAEQGSTPVSSQSTQGNDGFTDTTATTTAATQPHAGNSSSAAPPTTATGALPAPTDGTYTYDETADTQHRTTTERWSSQRTGDAVLLTSTTTEDQDGDTLTTVTKFRVTRTAMEMLSETSTYNAEPSDTCTYKPAVLVVQLPLKVGNKWHAKGSCGNGQDQDLALEVSGTATDTIGGQAVTTFLIKATQTFDSTDETTGERTTYTFTDTSHVDPSTLLKVVEDLQFNFGADKTTVHRQLRSLTPS